MGLNDTPSGERIHIGFFGRRNAGKSSLVNAVTGQELSVVSQVKGTTTDPVSKTMELPPLGPVVIIDTPGLDDSGSLGQQRVRRAKQVLNRSDCAVLVVDAAVGMTTVDRELLEIFREKSIPYVIALNKCELVPGLIPGKGEIPVSAEKNMGIWELKERIAALAGMEGSQRRLVGDLLKPEELAVLVVPIDSAAPKGRLILPQQQAIRDILEAGAIPVTTRETELQAVFRSLKKPPAMVITDSQAFKEVNALTPKDIPLTSFSILMARYKGFLDAAVEGAARLNHLENGDRVLISEGCTHHRQCDDIGTVKLPRWLKEYTGKELVLEHSSGMGFPEDLSHYRLIVHCGGCMLNQRELAYRQKSAADAGVPFTNYGTAIAQMHGILRRSLELFPHLTAML